jgi:hypothetical protein
MIPIVSGNCTLKAGSQVKMRGKKEVAMRDRRWHAPKRLCSTRSEDGWRFAAERVCQGGRHHCAHIASAESTLAQDYSVILPPVGLGGTMDMEAGDGRLKSRGGGDSRRWVGVPGEN